MCLTDSIPFWSLITTFAISFTSWGLRYSFLISIYNNFCSLITKEKTLSINIMKWIKHIPILIYKLFNVFFFIIFLLETLHVFHNISRLLSYILFCWDKTNAEHSPSISRHKYSTQYSFPVSLNSFYHILFLSGLCYY